MVSQPERSIRVTIFDETHMIEFKREHVMNIIFNHVRFPRLSGTGYPTIKINYIRMKREELIELKGGYGGPGSTNCCCIGSNGWPTICRTMNSESECSYACSGNYWWY